MRTIFKKKAPIKRRAPVRRRTVSVAALATRVAALATHQRRLVSKVMYQQIQPVTPLGNVLGDAAQVYPITKFSNWSRIFGTDADDEQGKKCIVKNSSIQWTVNTDEISPTGISMFVVSLKGAGSDLFSAGTLGTMTLGTHYCGNGASVLMNMNYFNIHYVKRWQQGAYAAARPAYGTTAPGVQVLASETASLCKRGKISLKYNGGKGLAVVNPSGDWKAGGYPKSETSNYYIIMFTDNSTSDTKAPYFSYNMVHSVEVSA